MYKHTQGDACINSLTLGAGHAENWGQWACCLHDLVQQLADHREEREADARSHADLNHSGDGAGEEGGGALVLQHLHGAVHGALVHLLGGLALHSGLDAVLRLSEDHGTAAGEETSTTVVDGVLLLRLVAEGDEGEDLHLEGHSHGLVGALLQDGGEGTSVQAQGTLGLQDLHDGIARALVLAGVSSLVISDSSLHSLDRGHCADSLADAGAHAADHVHGRAQLAGLLVTADHVHQVRVGSPSEHLLEAGTDDTDAGTTVETLQAVLLPGLGEAVNHAAVLGVRLGLQLELRLDVLRGVGQEGLGSSGQETLHHGLHAGVILGDESHGWLLRGGMLGGAEKKNV
mmetsp:Transcript_69152/g.144417  ORF Transcript_69152/g.144417 Transcript_69152/m.144417 type:complete len:344 (-) Transcript_69152:19-1050(-)